MYLPGLFAWKEAPFLRFIIPFITGIMVQSCSSLSVQTAWLIAGCCCACMGLFSQIPLSLQFRYRPINGIALNSLLFIAGVLLVHYKNIRRSPQWFTPIYTSGAALLVTIEEPLTEKAKSYRTVVSVEAIIKGTQVQPATGKLMLHFQKDSIPPQLHYGDQLLFAKTPEHINNTANPNAFNYARYCALKSIWHQVYLGQQEYTVAEKKQVNPVKKVLFYTRKKVLNIIRENIPDKKQAGLAEALLIGYKDELDKQLLQSYINTGVVHIIAISGLHLGLIYGLLVLLCRPLRGQWTRWATPLITLAGLWLFTFLAGASPSVLRSAVMFTCLIIGNSLTRPVTVYNSLAASAFLLLCYDPWLCLDIGFQLSYAAVLSIALFMKPLYQCLFIQNKYLHYCWKLAAVTLAAQILTLPISIYHFHQVPNLFLIANLIAVPLSGIILMGELLLCALSFIPAAAKATGWLLDKLIRLLNGFIELINQVPFNTTGDISINLMQLILLYTIIGCLAAWLLQKKKAGLLMGLGAVWLFCITGLQSWWSSARQQKIIVYNIPKHQAIDFIDGRHYLFTGDSLLLEDPFLQDRYLKPCRIAHHATPTDSVPHLFRADSFFRLGNTSLLIIDETFSPRKSAAGIPVDLIVLSRNAKVTIQELSTLFKGSTIIIDGTNSRWKTSSWQQDCHKLGIACHAVANQGAFVFTLH